MNKIFKFPLICTLALMPSITSAQQVADKLQPESTVEIFVQKIVKTKKHMVVAANSHAAEAGNYILSLGGNAVDAMVTVQLVLGLVEPQSSGIGGGAFLVYYDAIKSNLTTFDGRETAPANTSPTLFQGLDKKPLKFFDAVVGGRSVGTPGTVRLLYDVHQKHGNLPWQDLIKPAINLANTGFKISKRLHALIAYDQERLSRFSQTGRYFLDETGKPKPVGFILKNPAYAQTLTEISNSGAEAFYTGKIAEEIVKTVQNAPGNPGVLSLKDLNNYSIKERLPVCYNYRTFDVCGMGPPSSGALTVGQILGLIEPYDIAAYKPDDANVWRIIGDASRLAFADRGRYMADQDFVPMPVKGLLEKPYLQERAKLLSGKKALKKEKVLAGTPEWDHAMLLSDDDSIELPSTSHFSIIDSKGNVVSMTTTIENLFGSRLMVGGFLLNNELTDFSFNSHRNGIPIANRVEPHKRPRSSMAPTIVMKNGKPYIALGSPGGSRIINYVANTLIALLDWKMNIQQAVSMPHLANRFGTYDIEKGENAQNLADQLTKLGYKANIRDLNSGLHIIKITPEGLEGAADPRREGLAIGE